MFRTAGIEGGVTGRTPGVARDVFVDRETAAARAAQYCLRVEFGRGPHVRDVVRGFAMAFEARIPAAAAFECDRDYVERGMPVCAAGFGIDIDAVDLLTVDKPDHLSLGQSIRSDGRT